MPSRKLRVAVLFGGKSAEHEVSLVSARAVMEGLNPKKYDIVPVGITKEGCWLAAPNALELLTSGTADKGSAGPLLPPPDRQRQGIDPVRSKHQLCLDHGESREAHFALSPLHTNTLHLASNGVDVVFPVLHGTFGEDGTVQGFLELAGVPYVGAGVLASAVGMDKIIQKQLFAAAGLPIVPFRWYESREVKKSGRSVVERVEKAFRYPIFVKPANMGSSIGITKAHNRHELLAGLRAAVHFDRKILIEKGIQRAREIEIAILGNHDPVASVPGEVVSSNEFYDYNAKYVDGKSVTHIPAQLPPRLSLRLQNLALRAFRTLDASGMARVDFLLSADGKRAYVNEVNTIPGFTPISMYSRLWEASGVPFSKLLDRLIALALQRHKEMRALARRPL